MKKISLLSILLGLSLSLLSSCSTFKQIGDHMFEGTIDIPNARVTHASPVKTRDSTRTTARKMGFKTKGDTWNNEQLCEDTKYQTIHVSGGGYRLCGDVDYNGTDKITRGKRGILKVGKKTKKFKGFELCL